MLTAEPIAIAADPALASIFRVRFLLTMTDRAWLHPCPGPTLYALLAAAYGTASGSDDQFPDSVLLDTPEMARVHLRRGDRYAFGITILADDATRAGDLLRSLRRGLMHIGEVTPDDDPVFGGNFTLDHVEDLCTAKRLTTRGKPAPMSPTLLHQQIDHLRSTRTLTLRFHTPLRASLPGPLRREGHAFFDRTAFPLDVLLKRLAARLKNVRLCADSTPAIDFSTAATLTENRLVWLDVAYGPRRRRKSLGGAAGRITLDIADPRLLPLLVVGQYAHVGEATRFGFGAYHIEQPPTAYTLCPRSSGLLELAFTRHQPDQAKKQPHAETQAGLQPAMQAILAGNFSPHPHSRIQILRPDGAFRELAVPSDRDRALQRRLLELLNPALDAFFESSSFAYRRGLGRRRAALALRDAFRNGYRLAVKADFHRYFDSIDHAELRERLDACLHDDRAVALIMNWVSAGAPAPNRGIPTGAPLSPLLANLFLDQFDERVMREGGLLVRCADDFLILFRDESRARAYWQLPPRAP